MDREVQKGFLGTGWKFPVSVDPITGRIKTSQYEEDIKEAIYIIITTRKGERAMEPEFGCRLSQYVFETMDYSALARMEHEITEALSIWEPRITKVEVMVEPDPLESGKINISINYQVRSTNNPFNLVFPYFMNEGILI